MPDTEEIVDAETGEPPEAEERAASLAKAFNDADGAAEDGGTAGGEEAAGESGTGESAGGGGAGGQAGGQAGGPEATADMPALAAPHHWPAEQQEMFGQLPERKWQEWLLERDRGMTASHTRAMQEAAPLRNLAEQWTPYLSRTGETVDRAANEALNFRYQLDTGTPEQRRRVIEDLAQRYGVSLAPDQEPSPEEDPFEIQKRVNAVVTPLQQQVAQLTGGIQSQMAAQQAAAQQAAMREVQEFRDEKGKDGKPTHPYFDEVRTMMASMAQAEAAAGRTPDIATLYEQATWADPSVRAKRQLAEKKSAEAAARKADQERARKARAAAGGLGGSGGGAKAQPKTRAEQLAEAWDEASAAG